MVVRELTGGLYFGGKQLEDDRASDTCTYTREQIERVAPLGVPPRPAPKRSRRLGGQGERARDLQAVAARRHRAARGRVRGARSCTHELVDSFAMNLATRPQDYDVILTENLFGDILSDLAAAVGGGLGLAPSASLGNEPPGIFEPVHGSAPDIAGQGEANPIAMILSVGLMFTYGLGRRDVGRAITAAVDEVLAAGISTADQVAGGRAYATWEVGQAVCEALSHHSSGGAEFERNPYGEVAARG